MSALAGARIGPNALIQVAHALVAGPGEASARHLFRLAGLAGYFDAPPARMVDELEVARLHRSVRANLGPGAARRVFRDAGTRTAEYLLANRIPCPLQALLRRMPAALAARVLLRAIGRHAWTFAGSGRFEARYGHTGNPLCAAWPARCLRLLRAPSNTCSDAGAREPVIETACRPPGRRLCWLAGKAFVVATAADRRPRSPTATRPAPAALSGCRGARVRRRCRWAVSERRATDAGRLHVVVACQHIGIGAGRSVTAAGATVARHLVR
jgi:divinyl protochlorophyllide a 8-vinyl-reductase